MELKLFPLPLVSYPTKRVPLHIFEDRYKTLISNSIKYNSEFGIIYHSEAGLAVKGCSVKVTEVIEEYPDGRYDIITTGQKIFKLENHYMVKDIHVGEISFQEDNESLSEIEFEGLKEKYLKLLIALGETAHIEYHISKNSIFELLESIQLPAVLEQQIISTESERERAQILESFFKVALNNYSGKINQKKFTS